MKTKTFNKLALILIQDLQKLYKYKKYKYFMQINTFYQKFITAKIYQKSVKE